MAADTSYSSSSLSLSSLPRFPNALDKVPEVFDAVGARLPEVAEAVEATVEGAEVVEVVAADAVEGRAVGSTTVVPNVDVTGVGPEAFALKGWKAAGFAGVVVG